MKEKLSWRTIQGHMMTGIGYMIPIVIASSLLQALAKTIGTIISIDVTAETMLKSANMLYRMLAWVNQVAAPGFQNVMYVVLAGYIAFSIADRNGIAVGMLAGYIASTGNSGFLGALLGGFAAGYFIKLMSEKIKVSRQWRTLMMFMIYPLIGGIFIILVMFFIVEPVGGAINDFFTWFINAVGALGMVPYYFVVAGMMAADCGGPINKAAFSIGYLVGGAAGIPVTPVSMGAMIAPLGFGLAAIADKFILKKNILDEELSGSGISSFVMGLFNITEGAIPLLLKDPVFMLPVNIISSGLGAVCAYLLNSNTYIGQAGNILGWFVMSNPLSWIFSLFVGSLFIAIAILVRRSALNKKDANKAVEE